MVIPSMRAPCALLPSHIHTRGTWSSLVTLAGDVKKLLLPALKVPSSFSQYVSQDGGPHICTLIVPSWHHIPLYLLFFQVIYIYISLALITLQPRFLQADPNQVISGASGNLSAGSSRLRIIKSWTHEHLQDLEAFQYGFRLDISHSAPS